MDDKTTYGPTPRGNDQRLWSKVDQQDKDDCWEWTGARNTAGYGQFYWRRGPNDYYYTNAHRAAYLSANGLEPSDIPPTMEVMHSCDNPPCCNPDHLSLGTHRMNILDALQKGRKPTGSEYWNAKLSDDQVREIRKRCANGESQTAVAKDFDLTASAVNNVCHRRRYASVADEAPGKD